MGNVAILWSSTRQSCVALSTAKAEYMALAQGVKECLWIRRFLQEDIHSVRLWSDNQGAIAMAPQSGPTRKVKHIDIKFHFVKDHVEAGDVLLDYCPTKRMIADALTKPLPRERTETLRAPMGSVLVQSDMHISPRESLMDNPASNDDMASNADMEKYADVATKSEEEVATTNSSADVVV
ncbi:hypothetical protein L7F22_045840 [Adiantum nelumboides]|nr:hypothetical protein [Adiantum nelumboides]